MSSLLPFLITGLTAGSLYGLAGLGLVLTYRTSGIFNFGHGAVAAAAAFVFYELHTTNGWPWPVAGAVVIGGFGLIAGPLMEVLARRLGDAPEALAIVATVGLLLGVQGALYLRYGSITRDFPQFLPTSGFTVSEVTISYAQVIAFLTASAATAGLYLFLRRARLGVAMRAVVDNPSLTRLSGESPLRVRRVAWSIGCAFAALSGILLAPSLGLDANLLTFLVVQAFGACAVGAFSSLPLTYLGGLVVGVAASLATRYLTDAPFNGIPPAVPFIVLVVVLVALPTGRLPRRRVAARSIVTAPPQLSPRLGLGLALGFGAVTLAVPFVVGARLPIWTSGASYVLMFASLGLLVWISGQMSLCHAAFAAVGATTFAHMLERGLPWLVALLLAGLATAPVGLLVALPAIRLSGVYLALATLGFGVLMQTVVYPTFLMFGSQLIVSARRPELGPIDGTSDRWMYGIVVAITVVCCIAIVLLARSRLGRLLRAMSESPTMLATHGLSVSLTRLIVFCLSAFFAGLAGALTLAQTGSASGITYGPIQSLIFLAVLAICGTRLLGSAVGAAALFAILPGYLTGFDADQQILGFGVAAIAMAIALTFQAELRDAIARSALNRLTRPGHGPAAERSRRARPLVQEVAR